MARVLIGVPSEPCKHYIIEEAHGLGYFQLQAYIAGMLCKNKYIKGNGRF